MSEALFVRNLVIEATLARSVNITIHTVSTAGKSMATRFGSNKKDKACRTEIPLCAGTGRER